MLCKIAWTPTSNISNRTALPMHGRNLVGANGKKMEGVHAAGLAMIEKKNQNKLLKDYTKLILLILVFSSVILSINLSKGRDSV